MDITTAQLFDDARTQNGWLDRPVPDDVLRQLYELTKWGPTSANCSPARLIFVRTPQARQKLVDCVSDGNKAKVEQAPVTAIIGMDMEFFEQLPRLFPHADAKSWFVGKPDMIQATAFRNSSLQGAYLMLAARALGLGCGPMSGFDADKLDAAFWAGTTVKTNFLCSLGHGDPTKLFPRSPRLTFDEACSLA